MFSKSAFGGPYASGSRTVNVCPVNESHRIEEIRKLGQDGQGGPTRGNRDVFGRAELRGRACSSPGTFFARAFIGPNDREADNDHEKNDQITQWACSPRQC